MPRSVDPMKTESTEQLRMDAAVLSRLACPACLAELRAESARLVCVVCARAYPVGDGIPVLIWERAEGRVGDGG